LSAKSRQGKSKGEEELIQKSAQDVFLIDEMIFRKGNFRVFERLFEKSGRFIVPRLVHPGGSRLVRLGEVRSVRAGRRRIRLGMVLLARCPGDFPRMGLPASGGENYE